MDPSTDRAAKSPHAFLTISEVSNSLNVPQHILRFWETKFPQLRPLKRAGGRRYFRPEDLVLLEKISRLLGQDGYTIRGVQKLLRDGDIKRPIHSVEEAGLPLQLDELDNSEVSLSKPNFTDSVAPSKMSHPKPVFDERLVTVLSALLIELVEIKNTLAR